MNNRLLIAAIFSLVLSLSALGQASVTVIHGIPDLPEEVEVFANGDSLFTFDFGDTMGPLELAPGSYDLEVRLAGDPVLSRTVEVTEGGNYTVLAHLTYSGNPGAPGIALSAFANPQGNFNFGDSRLVIRHAANAPAVALELVDLMLYSYRGQEYSFERRLVRVPGLANPAAGSPIQAGPLDVESGDLEVNLLAGGAEVFSQDLLNLEPGVTYIAYAVGDFFAGTFTVILETY